MRAFNEIQLQSGIQKKSFAGHYRAQRLESFNSAPENIFTYIIHLQGFCSCHKLADDDMKIIILMAAQARFE